MGDMLQASAILQTSRPPARTSPRQRDAGQCLREWGLVRGDCCDERPRLELTASGVSRGWSGSAQGLPADPGQTCRSAVHFATTSSAAYQRRDGGAMQLGTSCGPLPGIRLVAQSPGLRGTARTLTARSQTLAPTPGRYGRGSQPRGHDQLGGSTPGGATARARPRSSGRPPWPPRQGARLLAGASASITLSDPSPRQPYCRRRDAIDPLYRARAARYRSSATSAVGRNATGLPSPSEAIRTARCAASSKSSIVPPSSGKRAPPTNTRARRSPA